MRTYDHGFSGDKKVRRKKKNNSGLEGVQRYIASLSKEQISRMISDAGKPYVPKGADVTGRAIYENELRQNGLIQPKLEISNPQDKAEQQADKVAEGVMKGDVATSQKALSEKTTSEISTKGDGEVTQTTDGFDSKLQGTKGQGQKLDTIQRKELESHTGTDLSSVNIHTNSNASEMSESINAKAFTHGQDIYFKEGQYNPSSNEGKSLLAHEVAHTVQQQGAVQRTIQRQPTATTRVRDMGSAPHAEGVFHGDKGKGGYIIVPKTFPITKAYYNDPANSGAKNDMMAKYPGTSLLYDTLYSLADRFLLDLTDLIAANPGVIPEQIKSGDKIIIPYVPMKMMPTKPIPKISTTPVPSVINLPKTLGNDLGPVYQPDEGYKTYKEKTNYNERDIQEAAKNILESDPAVMNAFIYVQKIHELFPDRKVQEEEVNKFFRASFSLRRPNLKITDAILSTGRTDCARGDTPKEIMIKKGISFSVAVATYLHEMNHYMDFWFSRDSAKNKRAPAEAGRGTKQIPGYASEGEQLSALPEYLTTLIEQIIIDMKLDTPRQDEHWTVEGSKTPKIVGKREEYKSWKAAPGPKKKLAEFEDQVRNELRISILDLYGPTKEWKLQNNAGVLEKNTGVELGFSFEKIAYGFTDLAADQGVDSKKWAGNFDSNFEKKYYAFLKE
ncbi:MAG: DUF4157 domain-containing protein [Bacteroidia bacterium]